jgi:serine/threonine protein kinase HipA of HipAB toxin-antitoxin module
MLRTRKSGGDFGNQPRIVLLSLSPTLAPSLWLPWRQHGKPWGVGRDTAGAGTRQRRGPGPRIRKILEFLKGSDTLDSDQSTFLKAQMVFWLLGATDGHAKNFSIQLAPGGRFHLMPLYDIISTQPRLDAGKIKQNQMNLAMAVGTNRHYAAHTIVGRHFVQTAKASGLPVKR